MKIFCKNGAYGGGGGEEEIAIQLVRKIEKDPVVVS
jgi:hypothetical protein